MKCAEAMKILAGREKDIRLDRTEERILIGIEKMKILVRIEGNIS